MKVWIIESTNQGRGTTYDRFEGICYTEEQAFKFVNDHHNHCKNFELTFFDVDKNKSISSKRIFKWQLYNTAQDGHLDPPSNRDIKGKCLSMSLWGPQCQECRKNL